MEKFLTILVILAGFLIYGWLVVSPAQPATYDSCNAPATHAVYNCDMAKADAASRSMYR